MKSRLVDELFPDLEYVIREPPRRDSNAIVWSNFLLYGGIGSGKTETGKSLVEMAMEKYGRENVDAKSAKDLGGLLASVKSKKKVLILFLDDITNRPVNKKTLNRFWEIRQIWRENNRRSNGFLITVLGFHRLWGVPIELRSNYNFMFLKDAPSNEFDMNYCKRTFGMSGLSEFIDKTRNKLKDTRLMNYALLKNVQADEIHLVNIGLASQDYFQEVGEKEYIWQSYVKILDEICLACQKKKGKCKLSRVCIPAYKKLSKKTGLKVDQLLNLLEGYPEKVKGKKHRRGEGDKTRRPLGEEEPEGSETEMDMHDEDYEGR